MPAPKSLQPSRALEGFQIYCPGCLRYLPMPQMAVAEACIPVERRCTLCGWTGFVQFHKRQVIPHDAFLQVDSADPKVITLVKK